MKFEYVEMDTLENETLLKIVFHPYLICSDKRTKSDIIMTFMSVLTHHY